MTFGSVGGDPAMKYDKGVYTLKSGRVIPVRTGAIGPEPALEKDGASTLSPDERLEIAADMIARWMSWSRG